MEKKCYNGEKSIRGHLAKAWKWQLCKVLHLQRAINGYITDMELKLTIFLKRAFFLKGAIQRSALLKSVLPKETIFLWRMCFLKREFFLHADFALTQVKLSSQRSNTFYWRYVDTLNLEHAIASSSNGTFSEGPWRYLLRTPCQFFHVHTFILLSSFSRTPIHILLLVKGPKSSQKWFGSANLLFSSTLFELHHTLFCIFLPCHWSIAILHTE